jgi:PAS domain S-box-containing protein
VGIPGSDPQLTSNLDQHAEILRLQALVGCLKQENHDLKLALQTTAEHGDLIEQELYEANKQLKAEIAERELAQAALQKILATVTQDKQDLEIILEATTQHGDIIEYELYTQAVATMRESEDLLRAIAESTSILMILTQRSDGAIAYANPISNEKLGVSTGTLTQYRFLDFLVDAADFEQMKHSLEAAGHLHNHEIQIKRQDGQVFWVAASLCAIELRGHETLLITLYDIRDRKHAEQLLRESEQKLQQQAQKLEEQVATRTQALQATEAKYRSIFENVAEGIFQTTPEGRFLQVNPALARIYGYDSPEELLTEMANIGEQLYVQPQRRDELAAYLRRFDSITDFESQIYRRDGTTIWISENVRTVKDDSGSIQYYEGSVRDITQQRVMEEELRQQRQASERLLLNILPQPIAEQLKRGKRIIADRFPEATVLFADIVNFTQFSAQIPPEDIITLLNQVFSEFDRLVHRFQLEKIKTIGDAYMVVGGVPTPKEDHIGRVIDLAMEMMQAVTSFRTPCGNPVQLRIGIHTGPVVAGVISKHRFSYDLWGDTVNVASRMESQGLPNRIQVTEAVFDRTCTAYEFEKREAIGIKGKGLMNTYWLLGKVPTAALEAQQLSEDNQLAN